MQDNILAQKTSKLHVNYGFFFDEENSIATLRGINVPISLKENYTLKNNDFKKLRVYGFNTLRYNLDIDDIADENKDKLTYYSEFLTNVIRKAEKWGFYIILTFSKYYKKTKEQEFNEIISKSKIKDLMVEYIIKFDTYKNIVGFDISYFPEIEQQKTVIEYPKFTNFKSLWFIGGDINYSGSNKINTDKRNAILDLIETHPQKIVYSFEDNSDYSTGKIEEISSRFDNNLAEILKEFKIEVKSSVILNQENADNPFQIITSKCPVYLSKFGLKIDKVNKKAYHQWKKGKNEFFIWIDNDQINHIGSYNKWKRGRNKAFVKHDDIFNELYQIIDKNFLNSALWNYTSFNTNEKGDIWADGDYSIYSQDQEVDSSKSFWYIKGPKEYNDNMLEFEENRYSGTRGMFGFIRPYPKKITGIPLSAGLDYEKATFDMEYVPDYQSKIDTEIFVPNAQFLYRYCQICEGGWAPRDYTGETVWVEPNFDEELKPTIKIKVLGTQSLAGYSTKLHFQNWIKKWFKK